MAANPLLMHFKKASIEQIQKYLVPNSVSEKKPANSRETIYALMGAIGKAESIFALWEPITLQSSVPLELVTLLMQTWDEVLAKHSHSVSAARTVQPEKEEEKGEAKEKSKEKEEEKLRGYQREIIVRKQFEHNFFMWDRDGTWAILERGVVRELLHPEVLELFIQKIWDEGHELAIVSTGNKVRIDQDPLVEKLRESITLHKRYGESLEGKLKSIAYPTLSRSLENLLGKSSLNPATVLSEIFPKIESSVSVEDQKTIFIQAICEGGYDPESGQLTRQFRRETLIFNIPEGIFIEIPFENNIVAVFNLRKFIESRDLAVAGDLKHLQVLQALAQKCLVLKIDEKTPNIFGLVAINAPPECLEIAPEKIKFCDDKPSVIASARAFGFNAVLATNDPSESVTSYYENGTKYPKIYRTAPSSVPEPFRNYKRKEDWEKWKSDMSGFRVFRKWEHNPPKEGVIYVEFKNGGQPYIQYTICINKNEITNHIYAADLQSIDKRYVMPQDQQAFALLIQSDGRCQGVTSAIARVAEARKEIQENTRFELAQKQQRQIFLRDQKLNTHISEIAAQFGEPAFVERVLFEDSLVSDLNKAIQFLYQTIENNIRNEEKYYATNRFQSHYPVTLGSTEYRVPVKAYELYEAVVALNEQVIAYREKRSFVDLQALQAAVSDLRKKVTNSNDKYANLLRVIIEIEGRVKAISQAQLAMVDQSARSNGKPAQPVFQSSSSSSSSSSSASLSSSSSSSVDVPHDESIAKKDRAKIFYKGELLDTPHMNMERVLANSTVAAVVIDENAEQKKYKKIDEETEKSIKDALLSGAYTVEESEIVIANKKIALNNDTVILFFLSENIRLQCNLVELAKQKKFGWILLQCLVSLAQRGIVPKFNERMQNGFIKFLGRKGVFVDSIEAEDIAILSDKQEVVDFVSQFGFKGLLGSDVESHYVKHKVYLTWVTKALEDLKDKIKEYQPGYTSNPLSLSSCLIGIGGDEYRVPDLVSHCFWALSDFQTILSIAQPYCSTEMILSNLEAIQSSVKANFRDRGGMGYDKEALEAFCKNISEQVTEVIAQNIKAIRTFLAARRDNPMSSEAEKFVAKHALAKLNKDVSERAAKPSDLRPR